MKRKCQHVNSIFIFMKTGIGVNNISKYLYYIVYVFKYKYEKLHPFVYPSKKAHTYVLKLS